MILGLLFSGCLVSESEYQSVKEAEENLTKENQALKKDLKENKKQLDSLEKDIEAKDALLKDREETKAKLESFEKEMLKLREEFEAYRTKYRTSSREKASGEKLEVLKTENGQTYNQVTIRKVVPDGIHILHESGGAKISYTQLGPAWKDRFDFNSSEAETYSAEVAQKRNAVLASQSSDVTLPGATTNPNLASTASAVASSATTLASSSATEVSKPAPDTGDLDNKKRQVATLRQELLTELTAIFAKMKIHRQEHYKETDVHESGTYIINHTYNPMLGENERGGKKPGMSINLANDIDPDAPENSGCFDNNSLISTLAKARDLKDRIIEIKREIIKAEAQ